MIEIYTGDVLSVQRGIIVHGCNARGVMGSGVAKAVREKYPQAFREYRDAIEGKHASLGDIVPVTIVRYHLYIVNAITQRYYGTDRRQINYGALAQCFTDLHRMRKQGWYFGETAYHQLPLCFPQIGAGHGGGDWKIISEIIDFMADGEKRLYVYGG